ncbi:formimidoylglutamate deiminase [Devosia sp.]|uniref:formimidoylglutamate deiminase n=1 Tax=Devosia sp. TaxID=1871048 RepID=UPI001A0FD080|nr:formimidoylglutamate deiminase [Devosia sp.]MBE0581870.1 formimidoylglutamate deiminase [Devosia sp.]
MAERAALRIFASQALLSSGWAADVAISATPDGAIAAIEAGATRQPGDTVTAGPVLPPLANLHSHAFQRAMAGLAEVAGHGDDSFWTWRDTMYRMVGALSPDDVEVIATRLYIDMLKCGYGRVGEFHYLHHDPSGAPYADRTEMSGRILAAATASGIGMTLLPVFYAHANFGGAAPTDGQRRFIHGVEEFLSLMEALRPQVAASGATLGYAFHSLRAATPDEMRAILAIAPGEGPIHIHVAEQQAEVDASLAWSGRRPLAWLMEEMPVDARWCLIHATHANDEEVRRMAASGAVVGLCPATEASLGDGIFPATAYRSLAGRFGIGSDSHVSTSPSEELRLLEYGQRLRDERRVRLVNGPGRSNGRDLFEVALAGGAQALGQVTSGLQVGASADLVVLDGTDPFIATATGDTILDRWLFALGDRAVRDVMVAGRWQITDRHHRLDASIDDKFRGVLARLL